MPYVIKRYSNRKLYDTQESRYVTLEEIEEMIRAGREISVVDAASGEDLTSVTLTQIILENERNHRANLPSAFLHQLIKHGEAWQEFVQRTMRSSLEGFVSSQRDMERVFREWSTRAGWGPVSPNASAETKREAEAKRESSEAKRDGGDAEAEKLREEVSALRDRLRSLEERLQRRKADAK
jgi:polyhydroxyalkanoate synthesis repressor PhaR